MVLQLELSSFTSTWHWWNSYKAGYLDIQLGTQNSALLVPLNPGCSCCCSCSPGDTLSWLPKGHVVQMCWEQRSREHQQLFPTEPSASHLHWAHGLPTIQKSSWDTRQYEPWCSLWEFHLLCSFPLWNRNIRNFPRKWRNTMGLSYFLSIVFNLLPPQSGHRDIHCSTRASEDPSPGRPCLWESLSYLLFVLSRSYVFNW